MNDLWETVIGLEVHVELSTQSKIFCSCTTQFGGEPNTHCCPVCMGMPGTLPVLNRQVLEYAIKAGLALNCQIEKITHFDRKNYFYPDLPKAYQISQLYNPIAHDGYLDITVNGESKRVRIHEMHMEEDAGKLIHSEFTNETFPDYNRCGVPLLEIVSEPDFRNASEVTAYLEKIRSIFTYLGISDCKMQEGSMRADVNLSVRKAGALSYGTRTEMKNINSLKAIERAIESESARQIDLLNDGHRVLQETRHWNDDKRVSYAMRSKEDAQDYRYFPEPDIPPIRISASLIYEMKESLPEFSEERKLRFLDSYGLSDYDAGLITERRDLADFYELLVKEGTDPKEAANWIIVHLARVLKESGRNFDSITISPKSLAYLIQQVKNGNVNRADALVVLSKMICSEPGFDVATFIEQQGFTVSNDMNEIRAYIHSILDENSKAIQDYKNGKAKSVGFLVGQTMKVTDRKVNPALIKELIVAELSKLNEK